MGQTSIYRYVMYLVTFIILLILDTEYQIKMAKQSYLIETLILLVVILLIVATSISPKEKKVKISKKIKKKKILINMN